MTITEKELPPWLKLEPTRHRSIRVSYTHSNKRIILLDSWRKERRYITYKEIPEAPYHYDHVSQAVEYLRSIGIPITGITNGSRDQYHIVLTDNFDISIKGDKGYTKKSNIKPKRRT